MTSVRQYSSNINKPFVLLKWKVKADSHLFLSTTLLTYVYENSKDLNNSDQELKLKSTAEGMILQLLVKEGEVVQPGSPLLILQSCTHELIVKEICAQCGADLWKSGLFQSLPETDLKVTQEQAEQLEKAGERKLLKEQKLALLICVDKTLIDTINVQDQAVSSEAYCTKVRPGTRDFLKMISTFYELHFFTNGNLRYANKIAEILDPIGDLFSERIWTRQECFNSESGSGNLKAIFPHGDSMVCILDWQEGDFKCSAANVIYVKPFSFLSCNNMKDFKLAEMQSGASVNFENSSSKVISSNIVPECSTSDQSVCAKSNAISQSCPESIKQNVNILATDCEPEPNSKTLPETSIKCEKTQIPPSAMQLNKSEEENFIISCLGSVLVNIHKAYYDLYDQMVKQRMYIIHHKAIPDLKNVIPYYRQTILKGVNIVFTGIFPNNMDNDTNPLCLLAKSLGAKITKDLVLHEQHKGTTHIIATKLGTGKTNNAKKFGHIHIISPNWLLKCASLWERADEKPFLLKKDPPTSPESTTTNKAIDEETILHNVSRQKRNKNMQATEVHVVPNKVQKCELNAVDQVPETSDSQSCLTAALNLSPEVLQDMSLEVSKECSSEDSDDDDDSMSYANMRKKNIVNSNNDSKTSTILCNGNYSNDLGTLVPVLGKNGSLRNIAVPYWERPCDNNVDDYSDNESMCDYIYSEDEDDLIE